MFCYVMCCKRKKEPARPPAAAVPPHVFPSCTWPSRRGRGQPNLPSVLMLSVIAVANSEKTCTMMRRVSDIVRVFVCHHESQVGVGEAVTVSVLAARFLSHGVVASTRLPHRNRIVRFILSTSDQSLTVRSNSRSTRKEGGAMLTQRPVMSLRSDLAY